MSRRSVKSRYGAEFSFDVDDGVRPRAIAYVNVSEEIMGSGIGWRAAVRGMIRDELAELDARLKVTRIMVDPFERHGVLEAPMRWNGIHVIYAIAEATG